MDESDEHARWEVYRTAVSDEAMLDLLHEALREEPESALVSAVVVSVLERIDRTRRIKWVDILSDEHKVFASRRSAELGILEDFRSESISMTTVRDSIHGWSDWLQLKIAESVRIPDVLDCLSREGRTKRIRRIANESLRAV
ncbi:hypothetical protein ACIBLA_26140 [Streptomyces sp. NPDC050433]|uniref:hypothetical protein n=1 Tax=Streptomyces sp. NPDC050433 TaxID=3365615 RepID=UPI0037AAB83D